MGTRRLNKRHVWQDVVTILVQPVAKLSGIKAIGVATSIHKTLHTATTSTDMLAGFSKQEDGLNIKYMSHTIFKDCSICVIRVKIKKLYKFQNINYEY